MIESTYEKSTLEKYIEEISAGKMVANNIVSHPILTDKSIIFATARYGLMVQDFVKFSAGKNNVPDGDYYVAYRNVVDKIAKDGTTNVYGGTAITPHIDKRWHLTLRDINDEVYNKNMKDVAKAFVIGLANKNFVVKQSDTVVDLTQFVSVIDGIPTTISYQGNSIDGKIKNLYKALSGNPDLVRNVLDNFDKYCEDASRNSSRDINVLDTKFIKNLNSVKIYGYENLENIIDVFINFDRESTKLEKEDKSYIEKYRLLYNALFEVVEEAVKPYCFGLGEIDLKISCNRVLETLISSSYWEWNLNKNSMVYAESIEQIKNRIENI